MWSSKSQSGYIFMYFQVILHNEMNKVGIFDGEFAVMMTR